MEGKFYKLRLTAIAQSSMHFAQSLTGLISCNRFSYNYFGYLFIIILPPASTVNFGTSFILVWV